MYVVENVILLCLLKVLHHLLTAVDLNDGPLDPVSGMLLVLLVLIEFSVDTVVQNVTFPFGGRYGCV